MKAGAKPRRRFAVCINNEGHAADLERWKIYQVIPDRDAEKHRLIRVIDESGEDYLYPKACFALVDLPPRVRRLYRTKAAA